MKRGRVRLIVAVAVALASGCAGLVGPAGYDAGIEGTDAGDPFGTDAVPYPYPGTDAGTPYVGPGTDAAPPPPPPPADVPCVEGDFNSEDPLTGHCYMYFIATTTWGAASAACAALGPTAHLATSAGDAENDRLAQLAGLQDVWLGASDADAETVFLWITGEPLAYTNWRIGEPNDSNGEDCMIIEGDNAGLWDDRDCLNTYGYLCERE